MLPKAHKQPNYRLLETGSLLFRETIPRVLKHFDIQTIDSISESISEAVEKKGLRFAAAQAFAVGPPEMGQSSRVEPHPIATDELAAAYLLEYAGRLAALVGPWVKSDAHEGNHQSEAVHVLESLLRTARLWNVELVQAVIDDDSPFDVDALRRAGLSKLAKLYQMKIEFSAIEGLQENLQYEHQAHCDRSTPKVWRRYDLSDYSAWIDWMESTYIGTTDCPELNGVRTTSETFAGYLASSGVKIGEMDKPEWWALFDQENGLASSKARQPKIAAAFLLGHSTSGFWELSYMGVAPEFRGQGLGNATLQQALWIAQSNNVQQLWLAVDDRNLNAIRLYQRNGFEVTRALEAWFLAIDP